MSQPTSRLEATLTRFTQPTAFIIVFALSRLLFLAAIALATGGKEFAADVRMFKLMVLQPWAFLTGDLFNYAESPPLMPTLLAIVAIPLHQVLPWFFALRLATITWDIAGAALLRSLFHAARLTPRQIIWACLFAIFTPVLFFTSVVKGQEEVLSWFFAAAILLAVYRKHRTAAILLCSLAAASAKIFCALPLAALVLALPGPGTRLPGIIQRGIIGAIPAASLYGFKLALTTLRGTERPFTAYFPDIWHAPTAWLLVLRFERLADMFMYKTSMALTFATAFAVIALYLARRTTYSPEGIAALFATVIGTIFAIFYHVTYEYYLLAAPAWLIVYRTPKLLAALTFGTSLSILYNFLFGARKLRTTFEGDKGGREAIAGWLPASLNPYLGPMAYWVIIALAVVTTALFIYQLRQLAARRYVIDTAEHPDTPQSVEA